MDERRNIPATDRVLDEPRLAAAVERFGRERVKRAVHTAQRRARAREIPADQVVAEAAANLPASVGGLRPVLNATGVLLHTNLGRAPLSEAAVTALREAAGTCDVELDLHTGARGRRGANVTRGLLDAVPEAESAHVVGNGAAALTLAATALASGREIVLARGEMVEIGAGFRIPELLCSTGARLREVGTTNRVELADYRAAIGAETGFVLKVHPSNFVISGFTSSVEPGELGGLDVPLVVDIGSGLLEPHPRLPDEPDARTTLRSGADLVVASCDKLLGGPQAGLLLGRAAVVDTLRRHPLARALRPDKLTLAALHATLNGPPTPTARALERSHRELRARAERIAESARAAGVAATAVDTVASIGGGGAPGARPDSAAVALPEPYSAHLRGSTPPVLPRVESGRCLVDLFALGPEWDAELTGTILRSAERAAPTPGRTPCE
ncbi:L-seryl-tRNA(Sec) selenium transferase [Actinopolyspora xinjiangensis]|uniref:L-seryl-tRNA(Sec) selenium transferase n=1 Tax=Actinopolyspora xinjiangensis TaxID=405564 RepID=A0A1H0RKE2_9ACTN|nr:L-seryl-tRNA(Sec) selenium transferase [Actinopolyspora xinjiangensis]SDP29880.1 L-seryl-tRNA(Sec) selenium transferase [Actinopolyspora xinjiangensis]